MAVQEILTKRYQRRAFFAIFVLLVLLMLVSRYMVLPLLDPSLQIGTSAALARVLETALASLIVTVAIGGFVFWLTPGIMSASKIEIVEPREIGRLLETAMSTSPLWWYKGGAGRYLR